MARYELREFHDSPMICGTATSTICSPMRSKVPDPGKDLLHDVPLPALSWKSKLWLMLWGSSQGRHVALPWSVAAVDLLPHRERWNERTGAERV